MLNKGNLESSDSSDDASNNDSFVESSQDTSEQSSDQDLEQFVDKKKKTKGQKRKSLHLIIFKYLII